MKPIRPNSLITFGYVCLFLIGLYWLVKLIVVDPIQFRIDAATAAKQAEVEQAEKIKAEMQKRLDDEMSTQIIGSWKDGNGAVYTFEKYGRFDVKLNGSESEPIEWGLWKIDDGLFHLYYLETRLTEENEKRVIFGKRNLEDLSIALENGGKTLRFENQKTWQRVEQ